MNELPSANEPQSAGPTFDPPAAAAPPPGIKPEEPSPPTAAWASPDGEAPRPAPRLSFPLARSRAASLRDGQRRLVMLVLMLGLIVIAIQAAAEKSNWYWLTGRPPEQGAGGAELPPGDRPTVRPLPGMAEADAGAGGALKSPIPAAGAGEEGEKSPADGAGLSLPPRLLRTVRDDVVGVKREELPCYFEMLRRIRDANRAEVARAARGDWTYAQLFRDVNANRGRLVTLRGTLRRLDVFPAGENPFGIETLFEAWVFTEESGADPYVVHGTSLPDGTEPGERLRLDVQVTGYLFKTYNYATERGLYSAPMLLASSVEPTEVETRPASSAPIRWGRLFGTALAGCLCAAFVCRQLSARRRRPRSCRGSASGAADSGITFPAAD